MDTNDKEKANQKPQRSCRTVAKNSAVASGLGWVAHPPKQARDRDGGEKARSGGQSRLLDGPDMSRPERRACIGWRMEGDE